MNRLAHATSPYLLQHKDNPVDWWEWGPDALAEAKGIFVAYPGQSARANGHKCWNWFEPRDQGREGGEAGIIAGELALYLAQRLAFGITEHDTPPGVSPILVSYHDISTSGARRDHWARQCSNS